MHGFERGVIGAEIRAWRDTEATDQTRCQIGNDIAVEVR